MIHRRHALWLALLAHLSGASSVASQATDTDVADRSHAPSRAHVQIGLIASSYTDTPNGLGLLAVARAEAEIAMQHAELALRDSLYLEGMRRHVEHALHALDPRPAGEGPGLGYGVRRAAEGLLRHAELLGAAEDASDNARIHAEYMAGAARSALERLDRVPAAAERARSATSAAAALAAVRELEAAVRAVWLGRDADRDGRVVWAAPEGGLRQVEQHMTLLRRGEGLITQGGIAR